MAELISFLLRWKTGRAPLPGEKLRSLLKISHLKLHGTGRAQPPTSPLLPRQGKNRRRGPREGSAGLYHLTRRPTHKPFFLGPGK